MLGSQGKYLHEHLLIKEHVAKLSVEANDINNKSVEHALFDLVPSPAEQSPALGAAAQQEATVAAVLILPAALSIAGQTEAASHDKMAVAVP